MGSRKGSRSLRLLPVAIIAVGLLVWALIPTEEKVDRYVDDIGDGTTTPTMATTDVSTLISDSGYTKYRVDTRLWQMFEDAQEPFWRFPHGLELTQYDDGLQPESTVVCDSAVYLSRRRLWQLDGNVVMVNTEADSFLTQRLFWDQNSRKIYSDSFIHIVRQDRIIEGYGFESDQSMLYYSVNRPTAILPAQRPAPKSVADSDSRDTAAATAPRRGAPRRQQPALAASDRRPGVRIGDTAQRHEPVSPHISKRTR